MATSSSSAKLPSFFSSEQRRSFSAQCSGDQFQLKIAINSSSNSGNQFQLSTATRGHVTCAALLSHRTKVLGSISVLAVCCPPPQLVPLIAQSVSQTATQLAPLLGGLGTARRPEGEYWQSSAEKLLARTQLMVDNQAYVEMASICADRFLQLTQFTNLPQPPPSSPTTVSLSIGTRRPLCAKTCSTSLISVRGRTNISSC